MRSLRSLFGGLSDRTNGGPEDPAAVSAHAVVVVPAEGEQIKEIKGTDPLKSLQGAGPGE